MKIAISLLNFRPGMIGGAETHLRRLVPHMARLRGSDDIVLVAFRDNVEGLDIAGATLVTVDRGDRAIVAHRILEAYTPWRCRSALAAFDGIRPDVAFFPQQSIFPKAVGCPCVLGVADLQHLVFPQYFNLFDRTFRRAAYERSLRRADHVVTISNFTRDMLVRRCGVEAGKITTVPHGMDVIDIHAIEPAGDLPRPFLYYPAATFPHKGHQTLLRTFAELRRQGDFPYSLVLTGKQTSLWPSLQKLIAELHLGDAVIHEGFVPFARVQRIYKAASAIVFPTEFEGFGLPVLEAVAFDKKVITSRLEVFDEIGVPREMQIDFSRPEELRRALAVAGATRLTKSPHTWAQAAQETLDVLRRVAVEKA